MKRRCSSTVRCSKSCGSSGMNARSAFARSGDVAMSKPPTRTVPLVGTMMPAMLRSVVVLPAPLGPTRPSTSPGATVNDSPRTASKSP